MITEKNLPKDIELVELTNEPMDALRCKKCHAAARVPAMQVNWRTERVQKYITTFCEKHINCKKKKNGNKHH